MHADTERARREREERDRLAAEHAALAAAVRAYREHRDTSPHRYRPAEPARSWGELHESYFAEESRLEQAMFDALPKEGAPTG
jgi:hypothetical protein